MKTLLILLFIIAGCKSNKEKKIHKGEFDLVGTFINDTILNGNIKFYDKFKRMVAIREYSNGMLNGKSISYYTNGNIHNSCFYVADKQTGYDYIYDSLGHLVYKSNFYFGKQIGHIYSYSQSNIIIEYSFNNFEGNILYYYSYDTVAKREYYPNDKFLIKVGTTEATEDENEGVNVFLYLFSPPHLRLNYKVCYFNFENKVVDSFIVPKNNFYFEHFYKNPTCNLKLGIMLNKYDSLSQKEIVIVEQLKTSYP